MNRIEEYYHNINVINQIVNIMEVLTFVKIQAFSLQACSENWHLNSI